MSGQDRTRLRRHSQRGPVWRKAVGKEAVAVTGKTKLQLPADMVFGRLSGKEAGGLVHPRSGNGDMWMLLQGAFADDWIQSKAAKGKAADEKHVLSNGTKASAGHASGAAGTMKALRERNASADNLYKMPRFQKVPCKVHIPRGHSAAGHS